MEIFKDYESMGEFNDNFDPEDIDTIRDYSLLQGIEIIGDYIDSESNLQGSYFFEKRPIAEPSKKLLISVSFNAPAHS